MQLSPRRLQLLLVEDNPADVMLAKEGLNGDSALHVVANGIDAMRFLRREQAHAGAPRPDLILLDLNLPQMDGREVLREVKNDENLKIIPVLVLTSSRSHRDVNLVYRLGATCFLPKPADLDEYFGLMTSIQEFWGKRALLPDERSENAAAG